jgi:hypothetical protein
MLILCLCTFGMSSIVGADLDYYTYYQRCRIVILSHFRSSCRSLALSSSCISVPCVVLSHGRPLALLFLESFPRVVLSHCRPLPLSTLASFSHILALSFSHILALSSSRTPVPCAVLSQWSGHSRPVFLIYSKNNKPHDYV